jgi:hypothetical protein
MCLEQTVEPELSYEEFVYKHGGEPAYKWAEPGFKALEEWGLAPVILGALIGKERLANVG